MEIITALKNPNINKKLKEKTKFNIIGTDIQYQEGILEMLQKNEEIDLIIISELLPGEMSFKDLISKIKNINKKIEIIVFLNNENEEMRNYLISKGIFNIFINNEITVEELIKIINEKDIAEKEIKINEEIKELKKIILEKENKKINIKKLNFFGKTKAIKAINLLKSKFNKNKISPTNNKKIISVIGTSGVREKFFLYNICKTNKK